jgi:HK97 family phage major capsid protein
MKQMHKDFGAYRAKLSLLACALAAATTPAFAAGVAVTLEKREEPTIASVLEGITKIQTAFDEYKKTNDARIEAIKKGLPTSDFDAKLAKMDEHIDALTEQKQRLERLETRAARPGAGGGNGSKTEDSKEETEYRHAFMAWVRNPSDHKCQQRLQEKSTVLRGLEQKAQDEGNTEYRATATVVGTPSAGGYALPKVIESTIARLSVDVSPIRQIATVRQSSTTDYHEIFDINGAAFEWVGEGDTRNQTNTPDMADIVPTFGMASAKPQASEESLNDLFFNVENWLTMSAGEAIGQGEGAAFVSGNGTKKPTGFLAGPTPVTTADSSRAFGTLQYVASAQAAALPTNTDIFLDLVYSLRARYRANAQWVLAKLTLAGLRKYKDTTGQYLWQPTLTKGEPDKFMGYGVTEAEDMPAVAASAFPIAFGDFKEGYMIVDIVGMRITRDEITTPGQVKFYIRRRVGGKLRNTQAIKLLKIAAS